MINRYESALFPIRLTEIEEEIPEEALYSSILAVKAATPTAPYMSPKAPPITPYPSPKPRLVVHNLNPAVSARTVIRNFRLLGSAEVLAGTAELGNIAGRGLALLWSGFALLGTASLALLALKIEHCDYTLSGAPQAADKSGSEGNNGAAPTQGKGDKKERKKPKPYIKLGYQISEAEVRAQFEAAGYNRRDAATRLTVDLRTARSWARRLGIPAPKERKPAAGAPKLSQDRKEKIISACVDALTYQGAATRLHMKRATLTQYLSDHPEIREEIERRRAGEDYRLKIITAMAENSDQEAIAHALGILPKTKELKIQMNRHGVTTEDVESFKHRFLVVQEWMASYRSMSTSARREIEERFFVYCNTHFKERTMDDAYRRFLRKMEGALVDFLRASPSRLDILIAELRKQNLDPKIEAFIRVEYEIGRREEAFRYAEVLRYYLQHQPQQ